MNSHRSNIGCGGLIAVAALCLAATALACTGCKGTAEVVKSLPPGTQMQSSTFGIKFAPGAVDGTPFTLGSHTTIFTSAQPADAGANLNRFEGKAPFVNMKSTVASGPVGEQLQKAGGPAALQQLLGGKVPLENAVDAVFRGKPDMRMPKPLTGRVDPAPKPIALPKE